MHITYCTRCSKEFLPKQLLIAMKLTFIFLFGLCLQSSAKGLAQEVSLSLNNASCKVLFEEIHKQTGISFFYNSKSLRNVGNITINEKNVAVETVLKKCFENKNIDFSIVNSSIVIHDKIEIKNPDVIANMPPAIIIGGKITNEKGQPLEGATISIKGSTKAAVTDKNGNFTLEIPNASVQLAISYVGYETIEISAKNRTSLNLSLKQSVAVQQDVVVVGYGTQKKINMTGAIETISSKQLQNRPVTSASALLQGLAPSIVFSTPAGGNTPGSNPTIQIRGQAALSGATPPLIIIDGIPASITDFNVLNPNDIDNISVLKDAAATAIYGARAPYGVLVVSTKMGKKNERPEFTYSANFGKVTPVRMPHTVDSYTFALSRNQAQLNGGASIFFTDATLDLIQDNINNPGKYTLAQLNPPAGAVWGSVATTANNNDMIDVWMRSSLRQTHDISVKGGSDKISYVVSAGYVDQPGILNFVGPIDNYKRYNFNGGLVANINDHLKLTYRSRYSLAETKAPTGEFNTGRDRLYTFAYGAWPTTPVMNPGTGQYSGVSRILPAMEAGYSDRKSHRLDNILALDLDITKGWTAHVDGTWRVAFDDYQELHKMVYETGPTGIQNLVPGTESSISKYDQLETYWTLQAYSAYEHSIHKHTIRVQAGAQAEEDNFNQLSGNARDLYVPDLPAIAVTSGVRTLNNDAVNTWATAGFFGRVNYDYNKKYLLELNGRYDGSGRYSRDQRWGFFPSASVGWNMSSEKFWQRIEPIVNRAKIRASYGTVGNQGNAAGYLHIPTMSTGSQSGWMFNGARLPYVNAPGILNMQRTWERYTTADLGLELGFFKNRLTSEFDYFNRRAWDVIGPATPKPSVLGTTAPDINNAEFVTKGWELQMKWSDNINTKWDYSVGLSLADAMSHVTKYNTTVNSLGGWYVGKQFNEIWGYTANRFLTAADLNANGKPIVDQSKIYSRWFPGDVKYEDLDGDGIISPGNSTLESHGDLRKIGNSTPRYRFGINLATGYNFEKVGRVDVSVFFEGVAKRDLFMGSSFFYWGAAAGGSSVIETAIYKGKQMDYYRDSSSNSRVLAALGTNLNAYFPRPYSNSGEGTKNFQTSTKYMVSGAYMRLKNLQVTYTLPNNWINRAKIKTCRVYFSAENIWVLSALPNYIDPEFVNGGRMYPEQAVYSAGVNIGF
jgi:TonB-linked SusC/RagA family outer membrane protein